MSFQIVQTGIATLSKITVDGFGDESVSDTIAIKVDPTFSFKRVFTRENEEVTGMETIITADALQSFYDPTHEKYRITYQGRDYQAEYMEPFYTVGTSNLEHIQVLLR